MLTGEERGGEHIETRPNFEAKYKTRWYRWASPTAVHMHKLLSRVYVNPCPLPTACLFLLTCFNIHAQSPASLMSMKYLKWNPFHYCMSVLYIDVVFKTRSIFPITSSLKALSFFCIGSSGLHLSVLVVI